MTDAGQPKLEREPMAYGDQKQLAHDGTPEQRRELAQRGDVRPEILYYLASDPDTEVRRNIARNYRTPRHADLLLAKDEQAEVRTDVATKISEIAVSLADSERGSVYRLTMQALEVLARDQLLRVRQILAETLKNCPKIPVEIMQQLAIDRDISVAEPVLEHSPLLSDEFLLKIITSDSVQGALSAIARRVALGEDIADAIVHNGDVEAIAELLGNESAQIREETLDRIVDQASGRPTWHKPLVHRPNLHAAAAMRIAEIVAIPLLEILRRRTDLDDVTISALKGVVLRRLDEDELRATDRPNAVVAAEKKVSDARRANAEQADDDARWAAGENKAEPTAAKENAVTARVRQMYLDNELNEHEVSSALSSGGREFVIEAIALLSKTPVEVVTRAISMRSTKAIVALCWKAKLSMRVATRVQMQLAHIPPSDVLRAASGDRFPLSEDEMSWQLEFISGLSASV